MVNVCISKISSCIKGYHVYYHDHKIGEGLLCMLEASDESSKNTIPVENKNKGNLMDIFISQLSNSFTLGHNCRNFWKLNQLGFLDAK